jgi:hypothetical protein
LTSDRRSGESLDIQTGMERRVQWP